MKRHLIHTHQRKNLQCQKCNKKYNSYVVFFKHYLELECSDELIKSQKEETKKDTNLPCLKIKISFANKESTSSQTPEEKDLPERDSLEQLSEMN
mmetsp:Transcript_18079/g.13121  ORF Transcript_18079/g.13121 Transcript_18079/m.13121 type:complete len:95 (-) Transcript_18079:160-444(-)